MSFDPAEHLARCRGWRQVTVTCSCGWVSERCPGRRRARESWIAHVILTAYRRPLTTMR